jgi:hypothetical protein
LRVASSDWARGGVVGTAARAISGQWHGSASLDAPWSSLDALVDNLPRPCDPALQFPSLFSFPGASSTRHGCANTDAATRTDTKIASTDRHPSNTTRHARPPSPIRHARHACPTRPTRTTRQHAEHAARHFSFESLVLVSLSLISILCV